MIDEYWAKEDFFGIEIRKVNLNLHPGDWFSQNIALGYSLSFSDLKPDLIVVDHSASCVPMLKWRFPQSKVLFYCHFPQQLVTPSRFFLYRWYSNAIGLIEAKLYESADVVMVNSKFTAASFEQVMPSVCNKKIRVVYPPCDVDSLSIPNGRAISRKQRPQNQVYTFLSMNRFWPEKRLDIIVEAAALLKKKGYQAKIQLAGSVMPHIPESRIYYELLKQMVKDHNVEGYIEFVPSPSEEEKFRLYRACDSALYTPPNEHFGIVPIEALEQRRPVIVIDSGGPAETVIEDVTGTKIPEPDPHMLSDAMIKHIKREFWNDLDIDENYLFQRKRFEEQFSLDGFGNRIDDALSSMFPDTYIPTATKYQHLPFSPTNIVVTSTTPIKIKSKSLPKLFENMSFDNRKNA
uniref:Alpha-1,3/1,6-mannosyltransferase ALG2 n=1 Tax=Panagrolaimus sp. PS1159 TaxID=55785 RepID=A0AC35FIN4_9BILA